MEETLKKLRRQYGEEALFLLEQFPKSDVVGIPTGSLLLDQALGVGGVPMGRFTEIYGCDGSGKTTLCQHVVANAQRKGLVCAYIDVENVIDIDYAEACGVDLSTLYLSQPDFAEEALGIAEILIKSGEFGVVVIDSIAALSPEKESEDKFEDKNVTGMQRAKLLNVFFRRVVKSVRINNVAVLLTNQIRDNTNSFFGGTKPTGGRGLKHYASVRIELKPKYKGEVKEGGDMVGQEIEALIKKNKVAAPWALATFTILAGKGIDLASDVLAAGIEFGTLKKRGSYITYDGEVLGQGKAATATAIRDNPELMEALLASIGETLEALK